MNLKPGTSAAISPYDDLVPRECCRTAMEYLTEADNGLDCTRMRQDYVTLGHITCRSHHHRRHRHPDHHRRRRRRRRRRHRRRHPRRLNPLPGSMPPTYPPTCNRPRPEVIRRCASARGDRNISAVTSTKAAENAHLASFLISILPSPLGHDEETRLARPCQECKRGFTPRQAQQPLQWIAQGSS